MKSRLLIFSLVGLFAHVAFSFISDPVPKTSDAVSVEKAVLTTDGIAVVSYETIAPVTAGYECFYAAGQPIHLENTFVPVAEIDTRLCIPWDHGVYITKVEPFYKSPYVDDSYIWKYSVQYNC